MSQLPKGWESIALSELAKFIDYRGKTPKKTDSGIPLITAKNIKDGYINREPREYIAEADYDEWMTRGIPLVGDVLLTTEAPLGNSAQIDIQEKFALAQRAICFQFHERSISRFVYYFLRSPLFKEELGLNATGSTVKGIKAATLKKLEVNIPPLAEQTRIVEKLDEVLAQVDTIKARLDGIPAILKRFRQSVLAAAVSGKLTEEWRGVSRPECVSELVETLVENNSHKAKPYEPSVPQYAIDPTWQWCRLGDIFTLKSGKTIKASEELEEGTIPYYKVGDMNDPENQFYMSKADKFVGDSVSNKSLLPANTIIFPKRGGAIGTNKKRILSIESLVDLNTMGIIVPVEFEMKYFYRWFETIDLGSLNTGSTIPQVNNGDIEPLWVPIPSVEEQKEIVRLVDQYFAFADTIEAQVKKAQARVDKLTQSILAKAFRGELVPQDPNDEPADKLLERIAAARKEAEALAKAAKKAGRKTAKA